MSDKETGKRLRFSGAQRVQLDSATCRVRVRLEVPRGGSFVVGMAEGASSLEGQLRSAAEATLEALRQTLGTRALTMTLDLSDVTTFDAFGKSGVMVSLRVTDKGVPYFLTGFSPVGDASSEFPDDVQVDVFRRQTTQVANVAQAVALAVLNATNRLLSGG